MSKSLGNVTLVNDLLKDWDGEVIRLALLKAHYRSELNWSEDLLKESKAQLDRWYASLADFKKATNLTPNPEGYMTDEVINNALYNNIFDDLSTPAAIVSLAGKSRDLRQALAKTLSLVKGDARSMLVVADLLGLLQKDPEDWFKGGASSDDQAEFDAIALRRQEARAAKDWAAADAARDEAKAKGIVLEDGPDGTTWRKA